MRRRRFLTQANKRKIHVFLKKYLQKVLSEEECITSFREAYKEAERVEVYGTRMNLTPSLVTDWLLGMPICVEYMTYRIVCMLLEVVTGSSNYSQMDQFLVTDSEIDSFYWEEMGRIICFEGFAVRA